MDKSLDFFHFSTLNLLFGVKNKGVRNFSKIGKVLEVAADDLK